MFGLRTPPPKKPSPDKAILNSGDNKQPTETKAKPSIVTREGTAGLRLSFGETGAKVEPDARAETQHQPPVSPKSATSSKPRPQPTVAPGDVTKEVPQSQKVVYQSRTAEAKACVVKAKLQLNNSRNLKTEIKTGIIEAVDKLYKLVKEAEENKPYEGKETNASAKISNKEQDKVQNKEPEGVSLLLASLAEHRSLIKQSTEKMSKLQEAIDKINIQPPTTESETIPKNLDVLMEEVRELRQVTEDTSKRVQTIQEKTPSYAEVLARPGSKGPDNSQPKHSIIVSSEVDGDTSEEVLGKVRQALDARSSGLQVQNVRKVKNQKVVLSCNSKEEIVKMAAKITEKNSTLKVEEAKNKDPLIIMKDLLSYNTDEDIVASLRKQNAGILGDLHGDEFRAIVRYRRRARNPHECHAVLQVSPKIWQRLTSVGRVHIDLQHIVVMDQSPLMQCTRCLGYGHGRKLCKEEHDLCSYCGGSHLRADCQNFTAGETPSCRNCKQAKYEDIKHNAFSGECPIRRKWDAMARSSIAYC